MIEDVQLTLHQAAAEARVKPQTIETWIHRGYLKPIPGTRPRRFWLGDVLAAEAGRNRKMRRKPAPR